MPSYKAVMTKQPEKTMTRAGKLAPKRGRSRPSRAAADDTPYHHGALHDALLKAAETVLERDGVQGLTLRAAAREAGVSHAAPTHHFGDMTGLLSELAAVGFRRFGAALRDEAAQHSSAMARLGALGLGYGAFGRQYPGRRVVRQRGEGRDRHRHALRRAMTESNAALAAGVGAQRGGAGRRGLPPSARGPGMVRAWSIV